MHDWQAFFAIGMHRSDYVMLNLFVKLITLVVDYIACNRNLSYQKCMI